VTQAGRRKCGAKILYGGAVHHHLAAIAPNVLCLTFDGRSKSHRVAGFRAAWLGSSPASTPATTRRA
jgi:alanine-synthesizing transaminase